VVSVVDAETERIRVENEPHHAWKKVGRSAGVRILVLPVSAILGIVNTRLIIEHFGQAAYAQYGLLVGIGSLLPFADLGVSAAVMNVVAGSEHPDTDPRVRSVLTTAVRILVTSMLALLLVSAGLTLSGVWPALLGDGLLRQSGPMVAALCLGAIAISMPVGLGQRILTGLGKNHISIAFLGLQTPVVLLALLAMVQFNTGGGSYIAVLPYLVTFLLSVASTYYASRKIRPVAAQAFRDAARLRTVKGGHVFDVAWPMLLQMIALPIAMQTDRIVLSHVSDLKNLAEYNLASQMYSPVWQVVSSAGIALWPVFARARARAGNGQRVTSPMPMALAFGGIAAVVCVLISFASPWLSARASGGTIHLHLGVIVAFSIFMVLQATKYPLGMYMTDARGLKYQAFMIIMLMPVNLGLSWVLGVHLGAPGPVIGSAVGVFFCQVLANWLYVRRELHPKVVGRHRQNRRLRPTFPDDGTDWWLGE
jgi:O-antigen/teichoic acid export membrane protein